MLTRPDMPTGPDNRPRGDTTTMAGPDTPLIRNCWFVAAWAKDVGRTMLTRRILGTSVLLYRTEAGRAVALHDRCPHRSLPLSMGCLEGDAVRCGYHGLLFGTSGDCLEAPPVGGRPPRAMRVNAFPLVERGPLLWIWMGDAPADEITVPDTWWLNHPDWAFGSGAMSIRSNYVALHENLLDLSHFTFLHPGNVGTPEYANAPYKVKASGDGVRIERFVADCPVPGIYRSTRLGDRRISRHTVSDFVTPGLHAAMVDLTDLAPPAGARSVYTVRVTHFVTPSDQGGLHYHFAIARDFAIDDAAATEAMEAGAMQAFSEDAVALEAIAQMQAFEPGFTEKSMRSDEAGVAMRRILSRLAAQELDGKASRDKVAAG